MRRRPIRFHRYLRDRMWEGDGMADPFLMRLRSTGIASWTLATASCCVSPSLMHPGRSGTIAAIPPRLAPPTVRFLWDSQERPQVDPTASTNSTSFQINMYSSDWTSERNRQNLFLTGMRDFLRRAAAAGRRTEGKPGVGAAAAEPWDRVAALAMTGRPNLP
jgi:hypothetical protein